MLACNKPKSNLILLRWREATTQNTSAFVVFYQSMFSVEIRWHKQGKWKKKQQNREQREVNLKQQILFSEIHVSDTFYSLTLMFKN